MNVLTLSWRYLWSRPLASALNLLLLTLGLASMAFVLIAQDRIDHAFERDRRIDEECARQAAEPAMERAHRDLRELAGIAAGIDLVGIDPPIPSVYFEVGGTPPAQIADGTWAEHHSPLFRIDPEPSIKAGVEAMTLAALELLQPTAGGTRTTR